LWALLSTFDVSDEALRRLEAEAARRGVSIGVVIADLAAGLSVVASGPLRQPPFVAIGASAIGITEHLDEILTDGFGHD
jgi:hypothetical protein